MGLKQISEDSRSEDLQEPQLLRFKWIFWIIQALNSI
jgi:hypothetical protein